MFPQVWDHLVGMGLGILMETELDTGYANDDLKTHMNQAIRDWDKELKQAAKEKKAAAAKRICEQKITEKRDTTPGLEDAGAAPARMINNIVTPSFPLLLGDMLAQCTRYSEIDVLEHGSIFLRNDMSDGEITE